MDEKSLPNSEDAAKIADAAAFFRDTPSAQPPIKHAGAPVDDPEGVYDVKPSAVPTTPRPAPTTPKPKKTAPPKPARPERDPAEAVPEVWTRTAEWGPTVMILAVAGAALAFLLFLLFAFQQFGLAFLLFLAGGAGLAVLSYPILITLERPVRITPEQAVRDYFAALSHHFPHYRRMWLLLSADGRVSGSFASLEGFQAYWAGRLAEIKAGRASGMTPLKFQVDEFRAEKSAGKSEVEAFYTVNVSVRGQQDDGPFETSSIQTTLIKGPDNMWYLDCGTLP
jgi:hypothetical protein